MNTQLSIYPMLSAIPSHSMNKPPQNRSMTLLGSIEMIVMKSITEPLNILEDIMDHLEIGQEQVTKSSYLLFDILIFLILDTYVGGRPPLCIHASKFVVHFKSNGALNDWGFRMQVVPLIKFSTDDESDISSIKSGKPQISYLGKTYGKKNDNTLEGGNKTPVHDRLYQKGMEKIISNKELMVSPFRKTVACIDAAFNHHVFHRVKLFSRN